MMRTEDGRLRQETGKLHETGLKGSVGYSQYLDFILWDINNHRNVLRDTIMFVNRKIIGNRAKDGLERGGGGGGEKMSYRNWVRVLQEEWAEVLSQDELRVAQLLFPWQILTLDADLRRFQIPTHVIFLFHTIREYTWVNWRSFRCWGKARSFWSTSLIGHFVLERRSGLIAYAFISLRGGKSGRGIQSSEFT